MHVSNKWVKIVYTKVRKPKDDTERMFWDQNKRNIIISLAGNSRIMADDLQLFESRLSVIGWKCQWKVGKKNK